MLESLVTLSACVCVCACGSDGHNSALIDARRVSALCMWAGRPPAASFYAYFLGLRMWACNTPLFQCLIVEAVYTGR